VQTREIYEEGQAGMAHPGLQGGNSLMPFMVGSILQIFGLFLTTGCNRLYSFRYHDTTTAVFNSSPSSKTVSTTALRLSQLTYKFRIFLSILRSSV
jgi:hypothetical protein